MEEEIFQKLPSFIEVNSCNSEVKPMFYKEVQEQLNNNWLTKAFPRIRNEYRIKNYENDYLCNAMQYHDDNSPKNEELSRLDDISPEFALKMFDINELTSDNLSKSMNINNYVVTHPKYTPNYYTFGSGVIEMNLDALEIESEDDFSGSIQIFDKSTFKRITLSAYFIKDKNIVYFLQTKTPKIYFQISQGIKNAVFLCVLCRFKRNEHIPIAVSYSNISDTSFSNFVPINGSILDTILLASKTEGGPRIAAKLSFRANIQNNIENPVYIWDNFDAGCNLISSSISDPISPLFIITDFHVTFKSPPHFEFASLRAYVLEKYASEPLPIASGGGLFVSAASVLNEGGRELRFIDVMSISVDRALAPTTHVVIQLVSDKTEVIGSCVVRLEEGSHHACIVDGPSLPKDYLEKKPKSGNVLKCVIRSPKAFVGPIPSSCLSLDLKNLSKFDAADIDANLVPLTERIISEFDEPFVVPLFDLWNSVERKSAIRQIRSFAFNGFDPCSRVGICDLLSIVLLPFIENLPESDVLKVGFGLPFIFDLLCVGASTPGAVVSHILIVDLLHAIPIFIVKMLKAMQSKEQSLQKSPSNQRLKTKTKNSSLDQSFVNGDVTRLNEAFAFTILTLLPITPFDTLSNLLVEYYNTLKEYERSVENDNVEWLIYRFFGRISTTPNFMQRISTLVDFELAKKGVTPYIKSLSPFLNAFCSASGKENQVIIENAARTLSTFCLHLENEDDETKQRCAAALCATLNSIFTAFESPNHTQKIKKVLVPAIAFIIQFTPEALLRVMFDDVDILQGNFIDFLGNVARISINEVREAQPTYDNPAVCQRGFVELSRRILKFILIVNMHGNVVKGKTVELLRLLLGEYQPSENFHLFFKVAKKLIEGGEVQKQIIQWLLDLIKYRQEAARCLSAALFTVVFSEDYEKTGNVASSSVDMMDALTAVLFECSEDMMVRYSSLLDAIDSISISIYPSMAPKVSERMRASRVIMESVRQQRTAKPGDEQQSRAIMKIADQYRMFPSMRLKWLRQLVESNLKSENLPSAFVAQMHIVALIGSAAGLFVKDDQTNDFRQPVRTAFEAKPFTSADFAFIPSLVSEIESIIKVENSDFNLSLLSKEFERAAEIARLANMYSTVRVVRGLQLRLFAMMRSHSDSAMALKELAKDTASIKVDPEVGFALPLQFYLIEVRKNSQIDRKVICVHGGVSGKYLDSLSVKLTGSPCKLCTSHHSGKCSDKDKDGVCIVSLTAINQAENTHSFSKFCISQPLSEARGNETVEVIQIETETALPSLHRDSTIRKYEKIDISTDEYIIKEVERARVAIDRVADEVEAWLPSRSDEAVLPHIEPIPLSVMAFIDGQDSVGPALRHIGRTQPSRAAELAQPMVEALSRMLSAYATACEFIGSAEEHAILLSLQRSVVNDFLGAVCMPMLSPDSHSIVQDPLLAPISFKC